MNFRSIRFRLTLWHAGLMAAVYLVLGGLTFLALQHYLEAGLGEAQSHRASQIASTLLAAAGQPGGAGLASEIETLYAPEANQRFIRITRGDGVVAYCSGVPKEEVFDPRLVSNLATGGGVPKLRKVYLPDDKTILIAAVGHEVPGSGSFYVEVGEPTRRIEVMLKQVLLMLALGLPAVLIVAVGGGYLLVQRALAPVADIARKAEQITQHNLSERLPAAKTGDELEGLSHSLNHMISRLEDAVQNSKRFVADASHELRTPLTVLRGELEQLARNPRFETDDRETAGSMLEEVERLAKIVEGLVALSRLDSGEAQAERVAFDLAALAMTTADQLSLLAEDRKIRVQCEASQEVPVCGDPSRMKQVIVNLLDNAIKYTPEGGEIKLCASSRGGHAILEVADNGIGIPAADLTHVFDRFFRVDKARSRDQGGAGLGLSIVKSICAAHGGEVTVESALGKGSCFKVVLPLAEKPGKTGGN